MALITSFMISLLEKATLSSHKENVSRTMEKSKILQTYSFLLLPNMEYFHAVTLNGIKYDYFKACIFSSARGIDLQFVSPIPILLQNINREHFFFLTHLTMVNTQLTNPARKCRI